MAKTELFSRKQPGGMFAVVNEGMTTGNIWFVDSGSATGADAAGYGQNPDAPFLTLDYADAACSANNGDRIYLMPGHAESFAALAGFSLSHAGVEVIGLGQGADRPTFTFTATDAVCTITGASISLKNVVLVSAINAVVAPLTVSGADCLLEQVEWRDTTDIEFISGLITTAAADRLTIRDCFYNGYLAGDACTSAFWIVGANGLTIENTKFFGVASVAFVDLETTLSNKVLVRQCIFCNVGTALTKNVVDTIATSTWVVADCYDAIGGYMFEGGSGTALAAASYTSVTLADDAITAAKIAADAIGATEIANGAIDAATFAAGAINAAAIADGAIDAATFAADAIDAAAIASGAIVAATFAAGAIDAAAIKDAAIDAATFAAGAINAAAIAGDAITADKIADDAIGADQIGAAAIVAATFGAGAINAAAIANDAIDSTAIADGAITNAKLAAGAISASTFAAGAIDATVLADGAIDSTSIAASAIEADAFAAGAITANAIAVGAIEADAFAASAITAAALAADAVAEIADGVADEAVTAHRIASTVGAMLQPLHSGTASAGVPGSITLTGGSATNDLYNGAIVEVIAGTGISQSRLITDYDGGTKIALVAPNWITAPGADSVFVVLPQGTSQVDAITANVITAASINGDAITNAKIADDAIAAENLATGAIAADAIAADTILGANNNNNAFDSGTVAYNGDGSLVERLEFIQVVQEHSIEKTDGAVTNGDDNLFTIAGGPILVTEFVGVVTTEIGADASTCTIQEAVTTPAGDIALSTAVNIETDVEGTTYTFTAAAPGVLTPTPVGALAAVPRLAWLCPIGTIQATFSAATTGVIKWYMFYKPLSPNCVVTMAV